MKMPTIHELEKILKEPDERIIILPDGSITTTNDKNKKSVKPKILSLDEVLKKGTY